MAAWPTMCASTTACGVCIQHPCSVHLLPPQHVCLHRRMQSPVVRSPHLCVAHQYHFCVARHHHHHHLCVAHHCMTQCGACAPAVVRLQVGPFDNTPKRPDPAAPLLSYWKAEEGLIASAKDPYLVPGACLVCLCMRMSACLHSGGRGLYPP